MKVYRGFTLIELLVVISIVGVLSTIGLTSFKTANQKARNSRREADIQQIRSALEVYRTEHAGYPKEVGTNFSAISTYLSGKIVKDPKESGTYTYVYTPTGCGATYCGGYSLTYYIEPNPSPVVYYNP